MPLTQEHRLSEDFQLWRCESGENQMPMLGSKSFYSGIWLSESFILPGDNQLTAEAINLEIRESYSSELLK